MSKFKVSRHYIMPDDIACNEPGHVQSVASVYPSLEEAINWIIKDLEVLSKILDDNDEAFICHCCSDDMKKELAQKRFLNVRNQYFYYILNI